MAIAMTDFTNDVSIDNNYNVTGNGIFDDMMEAINSNIKAQYDAGRITGADYASVYLGAMQTAISQSAQIMLNKALVDAQVASEEAKTALTTTQDNNAQKQITIDLLKIQAGSWTTIYNSGKADNVPDLLTNTEINSLFNNLKD